MLITKRAQLFSTCLKTASAAALSLPRTVSAQHKAVLVTLELISFATNQEFKRDNTQTFISCSCDTGAHFFATNQDFKRDNTQNFIRYLEGKITLTYPC